MNWAWNQNLAPTPKLILMALADAADDHGTCWPSIPTVAAKCSVSDRTVQRGMQTLIASGLMISDQRYRKDGSCSSNRYRLLLERGDKLSPPRDTDDTTPCHGCQGSPDTGVTPRTTIRTQKESPQPPEAKTSAAASTRAKSSGGKLFDLEYPKKLLPAERHEAEKLITALKAPLNQQVLDEWTGIISAGAIRSSALGCLRALIKRAQEGSFTPERALRVAQSRKSQKRVAKMQAQAKSEMPKFIPANKDNPLAHRIANLAKTQSRKKDQQQD